MTSCDAVAPGVAPSLSSGRTLGNHRWRNFLFRRDGNVAGCTSPPRTCFFCSNEATDKPIGGSVGKGGTNKKADVRIVQQFLNSTPPSEGGPALLLAEDGIIGPKTQAAIDRFQAKVLRRPDGRIDPQGPTIKALTKSMMGPAGPIMSPATHITRARECDEMEPRAVPSHRIPL